MERPKLSPDGTKIAALVAIKGKQYFAIMPLVGRAEPKFVPSTTDVNWWSWVNNDWLVVGIGAMDRFEGEDVYIRRAIGVRADAGKIVPLTGTDMGLGDDVLWIADDGSPRIRLALQKTIYQMPEVVEVDVSTGRSKQIVAPHNDILGWYADSQGTVRLGIGLVKDGRSSRLYYRNRDTENFRIIDRANTRDMIVPSLFLPERDQALAIDDADGFQAVYKLDLKTMKLGERVFGVPGYDVGGIVEDRESPRMLGVSVVENAPKTYWMDPAIAQVQAALDKAAGSRRAQIVSFSRDRTVFLVHIGAPDRPGSYYVMAGDGKLPRLADVNARIGTGKLNPVRTIRYKARDGLEIAAVLTLPAGRPAKGLPVIVMPHGGPFARDAESWDWWSQFLAERGYAVIQPNFRGSAGYGTAFAKKGQGQWGLAMQDDLNDALAHLVSEGIGDPKRACMVGASYGGYAAMRAAQRDGSLYRCAVSFAGVSDMPAMLRYDRKFLNSGAATDWLREQATDLKGISPITYPQSFSIPILLVHGKEDQRVPVSQSRDLAARLKKAGKDVRYIEQKLGDHHFTREEDRLQFLTELEAFLKLHNPA